VHLIHPRKPADALFGKTRSYFFTMVFFQQSLDFQMKGKRFFTQAVSTTKPGCHDIAGK
jgi:hypothetical protein